jgi:hypothetical protein
MPERTVLNKHNLDSFPKKAKEVTALRVLAIFADYDSNAPDSADIAYFSTTYLAKEALEIFEKDAEVLFRGHAYHGWPHAYCDGFEWCKNYRIRETVVPVGTKIFENFKQFCESADEQWEPTP